MMLCARWQHRVNRAAQRRVAERAGQAAVDRPDWVVMVLGRLDTEDDAALFGLLDADVHEGHDRRKR